MIKYDFTNKVAIVTGAGKGIGFEIVKQLVNSGAKVILNDIDEILADQAAKLIDPSDLKCRPVAGDSSSLIIMDQMIAKAVEHYGKLDFVVCNSGITIFEDFLKFRVNAFERLLEVNLKGTFFLAQKAAEQFINQRSIGKILLMSSVTGHSAHPHLSAYGMTKAAIEMLAKNLAIELAPYSITVNAIAPGATLTERNVEEDPAYKEKWEKLIPTGRVGMPSDIANTALFLLSEESDHINGQSIIVDGGWSTTSPPPE